MALYWHPFLAELLRMDYGDRLIVDDEVVLGDMPLKADLLLIRPTCPSCCRFRSTVSGRERWSNTKAQTT